MSVRDLQKSVACYKPWQHHIYWATRLQTFGIDLGIFGLLIIYTILIDQFIYLPIFWNFIPTQDHLLLFCEVLLYLFSFLWEDALYFPFCAITILLDKTELGIQGEITSWIYMMTLIFPVLKSEFLHAQSVSRRGLQSLSFFKYKDFLHY